MLKIWWIWKIEIEVKMDTKQSPTNLGLFLEG